MHYDCCFHFHRLFFRLWLLLLVLCVRLISSLSGMTKVRRVQFFKYSSECVTIRYTIRKFKKFQQIFLSTFTKRLHICKIFSSAYYGTQSYDYDVFELMTNIPISGSSRLFYVFIPSFSSSILISLLYTIFSKK